MEILKELANIVTKFKVRRINIITQDSSTPTKIRAFYEGLINDKFENDDEAAQYFYQSSSKDGRYKKLKSNVRNRLIDTIFFIDVKQPSYNEQQKAYYMCYKEWAAAKVLFGKTARKAAIYLCLRILPKAIKYEFTELVTDIAKTLRLHYGVRERDIKKYLYYDEVCNKNEEIIRAENLAEKLYTELIVKYVNNLSLKAQTPEIALEFSKQLEAPMKLHDSYKLHLYGNYIVITATMSTNNYVETVKVCERAINFFEKKEYQPRLPIQIFLHQQLVCYTQLRLFEEGKRVAQKSLDFLEVGSFNWFKHQELFLILSFHSKNYQEVYRNYIATTTQKRFKYLSSSILEMWKIYEAYIQYLIAIGEIDVSAEEKTFKKFRLNKFLNEVPQFSKDKRGSNIPILIIQILFLIIQKKYDTAIDRIEAIEKYCFRYLQKNSTFRSNCFLKMLLQIPISGFHRNGTVRRADKYIKRLKTVPLEIANQTHEVEIIPYENLWELALNSLDNKFHR